MREDFLITESLFADDSTLIGWLDELRTGKEAVKKSMLDFEEKCHDGKEEVLAFGIADGDSIRMLGTTARIKRGMWRGQKYANGSGRAPC